jgi:excisionase family DNA binding protein
MEDTTGRSAHDPNEVTMGVEGTSRTSPDLALTTAEAAEIAGVSARTIRRWITKGTLPAVAGAGGVLYVFRRDIESARIASGSRPSPVVASVPDGPRHEHDRDGPGPSRLSPDSTSEAAGAVLMAWRDTVLAPVVAELSATRKELGDAREKIGRLEVERDALWSRLEQVEAEQNAAVDANKGSGATKTLDMSEDAGTLAASPWSRFLQWLRGSEPSR